MMRACFTRPGMGSPQTVHRAALAIGLPLSSTPMRIMRIFLADRARHTRIWALDFQLLIVASACFVVVVMGTNVGASSLWRRIWCRVLHGAAAASRGPADRE